jgi:hypothetical protein
MKRKRRVIQDEFPTGDLDRDALTKAFVELREKRIARLRRMSASAAEACVQTADLVHEQAADAGATRTQIRAA